MIKSDHSLEIVRHFDASRQALWHAWTEPEELVRWWWPARFQTTYQVDLREGGTYQYRTTDLPDVGILSLSGRFLDVLPPERLMYTWKWESEEIETRVTARFTASGERTEVRLRHEGFGSVQERDSHIVGWTDCLDRLQALLDPSRGV